MFALKIIPLVVPRTIVYYMYTRQVITSGFLQWPVVECFVYRAEFLRISSSSCSRKHSSSNSQGMGILPPKSPSAPPCSNGPNPLRKWRPLGYYDSRPPAGLNFYQKIPITLAHLRNREIYDTPGVFRPKE